MVMKNKNLLNICLLVLGGAVVVYFLNMYMKQRNQSVSENFASIEENMEISAESPNGEDDMARELIQTSNMDDDSNTYQSVEEPARQGPSSTDCFPSKQLKPEELLPSDKNSQWAKMNPSGRGSLKNNNFLNAGFHVGINTVGQSLRNANLQLRSEPPNPQMKVSPWMQSTIEADTNRKIMEIGGCN